MPWCPKCKSEYREGFTRCIDCETDLVESLSDIGKQEKDAEKDYLDSLIRESYFYVLNTKWFSSDIIYKVFVKKDTIYFAKIGGQKIDYYINEDDKYKNENILSSDFLSKNKCNFKLNANEIREINLIDKRSKWTGPYPNYGKMNVVLKENKIIKFVILSNDTETVKEILKKTCIKVQM